MLIAGRIEDYSRRKDIINAIQTDTQTEIVKFLEALIIPNDSRYSRPTVYNGLTGAQVSTIVKPFKCPISTTTISLCLVLMKCTLTIKTKGLII